MLYNRNNRRRQTGLKTNINPNGKHLGNFKSNLLSYKIPSNFANSLCKENCAFYTLFGHNYLINIVILDKRTKKRHYSGLHFVQFAIFTTPITSP